MGGGNYTSNSNWACFVHYLKIINTVWKNNIFAFLKQIVWQTQKWHQNCIRQSGSWVTHQNNNVHVLNNCTWRTAWPTEILVPFLISQTIYLRMRAYLFSKQVLIILRLHTKHAQFWFGVQFLLKGELHPKPRPMFCALSQLLLILFWKII